MTNSNIKGAVYVIATMLIGISIKSIGEQAEKPKVRYRVIDIGTLPQCDTTDATSINNDGTVVGYAYATDHIGHMGSGTSRPFVWHNGKIRELPKVGGEYGKALTINANGDIGGYALNKKKVDLPVIWRKSKGYTPEVLSNQSGAVEALLDNDTAVGYRSYKDKTLMVQWLQGKGQILGTPRDAIGIAYGVNRAGVVIGVRGNYTIAIQLPRFYRAVMWKEGRQIALPTLSMKPTEKASSKYPHMNYCYEINDDGIAVGWSDGLEERRACLWRDGLIKVLPTPDGYSSEARAINRDGIIVGEIRRYEKRIQGACIWQDGKVEDLNDLIPADSGWKLWTAQAISDKGLIVGIGRFKKFPNDTSRAFLLIPVSP